MRCLRRAATLAGPVMVSAALAATIPADFARAQTADASAAVLSVIDAALAAGRLEDARDIIARTAPTSDSAELRLRSAELALANNALSEAITAFSALTAAIGGRAHQGIGLAKFRQGDVTAAKTALETAVAADPALVRSWIALGVIADRGRDFALADAAYAHALAIAPLSAPALSNRGYSLMLRGRYAEAEVELAKAVGIDPQLKVAATNLRLARALQGRYRDAFDGSTEAALATDLNTVGFGAMARGDYKTAESYFNRALNLNPKFDPVAWANLSYLKSITQPMGTGVSDEPASNR